MLVSDIFVGYICVSVKLCRARNFGCFCRFSLHILNCFVKHLAVKVIAYRCHMSALADAKYVAGASYFKVAHCNFKAGAKLCEITNRFKSLLSRLLQKLILVVHKKCICGTVRPSDTASKLVKL